MMSITQAVPARPSSESQPGRPGRVMAASIGFVTLLLLSAWFLTGNAATADAASFDCKKASQPLDKRICGDADLSKLDDDLAAAYGKAKAGLSPDGQKVLQAGQRDWLGFSRRICKTRLDPKIAKQVEETPEDCLKGEYRDRIEDLEAAVTRIGDFTFGRVDTYQLSTSDPKVPSSYPGFSYTRASWPRIDLAPAGIDAAVWNKAIAAAAGKLALLDASAGQASGDQTNAADAATQDAGAQDTGDDQDQGDDIDVAYNFGLVTPQLISVELTVSEFSHGAAHPNGGSDVQNIFLADGHALAAKDLFRTDQDWQAYLVKRSHAAWLEIMTDAPDMIDDKAIADVVKEPGNWLLTDKGITVLFPLYSVGPYVVGEQQVDFTWDELKPYLVDKLPFTRS